MRWVKHLTTSTEDPFISGLLDRFGHAGYAIYWMIVERIARGMDRADSPPEATMTVAQWVRFTRSKRSKLSSILRICEEQSKIETRTNGEYLTIRIEKIAEYRDEYSRKLRTRSGQGSGQDPDRVVPRAEQSRSKKTNPVDEPHFRKPVGDYLPSRAKTCSVCGEKATYVYQYRPYCDAHKSVPVEEAR